MLKLGNIKKFFNIQLPHSCSCTTTTSSSTIRIWHSSIKQCSVILSSTPSLFITNIGNKFFVATFSINTFKWELMSLSQKENTCSRAKRWRDGSGTQLISKKLLSDATDNHSRIMQVTSLILSSYSKISLDDTLMILLRNLSKE